MPEEVIEFIERRGVVMMLRRRKEPDLRERLCVITETSEFSLGVCVCVMIETSEHSQDAVFI